MIDYEKLKIAHNLILRAPENYSLALHVSCNFNSYHKLYALNCDWFEDYESIDDLIAKLQELKEPEQRYKIGQEVWYVSCEFEPISTKIDDITWHEDSTHYLIDEGHISESKLYPSKQALIEAQIEHWTKLKIDEISASKTCPKCGMQRFINEICWSAQCSYIKCQHEPDDNVFLSDPHKLSCKKCGEFYR